GGDFGDDLLREDVERHGRNGHSIQLAARDSVEQRSAFHQLVTRQRKKPRLRHAAHRMVRPARALQEGGDGTRRSELTDEPDITASSGESGISMARSRCRTWPASTIAQSASGDAAPVRKRAISSRGFCVAESPTRTGGRTVNAARRSSDNARWLPRLLGASAWISSTMTVRVVDSILRPDSEPRRI